MADQVGHPPRTVDNNLRRAYAKLGIEGRHQRVRERARIPLGRDGLLVVDLEVEGLVVVLGKRRGLGSVDHGGTCEVGAVSGHAARSHFRCATVVPGTRAADPVRFSAEQGCTTPH